MKRNVRGALMTIPFVVIGCGVPSGGSDSADLRDTGRKDLATNSATGPSFNLAGGTPSTNPAVGVLISSRGLCTATRIHKRYVLTAAHCENAAAFFVLAPDIAHARAYVESHNTSEGANLCNNILEPCSAVSIVGTGWLGNNDAASDYLVLQLAERDLPGPSVTLEQNELAVGAPATEFGYGWAVETSPTSMRDRQRSAPFTYVKRALGAYLFDAPPPIESEVGDSGGPFMIGQNVVAVAHSTMSSTNPFSIIFGTETIAAAVPDNFFGITLSVTGANTNCNATNVLDPFMLTSNAGSYEGIGKVRFKYSINDTLSSQLGIGGRLRVDTSYQFNSGTKSLSGSHTAFTSTSLANGQGQDVSFPVSLGVSRRELAKGTLTAYVHLLYERNNLMTGKLEEGILCSKAVYDVSYAY